MIFFGRETAPEILGNSRSSDNGGGTGGGGICADAMGREWTLDNDHSVCDSNVNGSSAVETPRVKICPVCGVNPLPRGNSACSVRCRKRKERILRKAREESLLYLDKD